MQHAALVDSALRVALDAAGLSSARKLGKWLRSVEGQPYAGVQLDRIGADNQGVIWRVLRVSHSHSHAAHCGDDDRRM
jgi:hypothetical protein